MRMDIPNSPEHLTATLKAIPDGVAGIRETLRHMVDMTRAGKRSLAVRGLAMQILADVPQKAWLSEVKAIHQYVRDFVRYTRDINDIETVQTPDKTIEFNQGDCDDKSVLVASLLESVGHPTRFVAVGRDPDNFDHVFPETKIGGHWVSVETTEPVPLGWYPKSHPYRLVYNV